MCGVSSVHNDLRILASSSTDPDCGPAESLRSHEILQGIVAHVRAVPPRAPGHLHHHEVRYRAWLPMISAELVGVDDVVDQPFKTKGRDFSLLGDQVAVGDDAGCHVAPEVGERSLRAHTKGAQNLIKDPPPVALAK